jgi:hypothetical protein
MNQNRQDRTTSLGQQPRGTHFEAAASVTSRKLVSQLSAVGAPHATWSSFPVVGSVVVSSAMEASLR